MSDLETFKKQIRKLCMRRLLLQRVHWKIQRNRARFDIVNQEIERRKRIVGE